MLKPDCKQAVQEQRTEIRQLLHDTLAQTLFSASTLASVITTNLTQESHEQSETMIELQQLLQDAVGELKDIQIVLNDDDTGHFD